MAQGIVYRYELSTREGTFQVPRGAKAVHCAMKGDLPNLWMECFLPDVGEGVLTEPLSYLIIATGSPFPLHYEHLGTFIHDDMFVWHVYRKPNGLYREYLPEPMPTRAEHP